MPTAPTFRERMMDVLMDAPSSAHEIAAHLQSDVDLVRATLHWLIKDGLVEVGGELPRDAAAPGASQKLYQMVRTKKRAGSCTAAI